MISLLNFSAFLLSNLGLGLIHLTLLLITDNYVINSDYVNKKSRFKLPTGTVKEHSEKEVNVRKLGY